MKMRRLRLGLALMGAGALGTALPASTQGQQIFYREDAGTALTRHLRTLSEQPRSVSALMGAGKAALELGDPQAALTFFARAEEISPRDGRVKAGMGSAFVAMEQPRTALRLFQEAASLGVPEAEFAGDRGLIHDLAGDTRRAQADYSLALSAREDDEVRRRLALSFAISGERERALSTIDVQLRRQDRAAWRTRAFILALAGDERGATQVAQSTMPMQAAQLQPFFARLPSLNAAQRAMAVHFGHFPEGAGSLPASGTQYASAAPPLAASRPNPTQAGRPDPRQAPLGTRREQPLQPRSIANVAPARPAPRQVDRQGPARQSGLDWARGYSRERNAGRPALQPRSSPPSGAVAATGQRQQARGAAQVIAQAPPPAGAQGPAALVRNLPAGNPTPAPQAAPPAQRAPLQLAEARPTPPVVAPTPNSAPPVRTAPAPNGPQQAGPEQTGPVRSPLLPNAPVQNMPGQLSSALLPPSASPVQSPPPVAPLTLPPSQSAQQAQANALAPAILSPTSPAGPSAAPALQVPVQNSSGGASLTSPSSEPAQQNAAAPTPQQPPAALPQRPAARSFADIAATIASLPGDAAPAPEPAAREPQRQVLARLEPAAKPPASASRTQAETGAPKSAAAPKAKAAAPKAAGAKEGTTDKPAAKASDSKSAAAAKKAEAEPKQTSRHWVQIAGGANEAAMTSEFNRLKGKAPKLLGGKIAWTTPLRATNRLLVGPFKTSKEAQDFVNELAKLDLPAFSWTSPAGQEIAKLSAK